jgi:Ca2+-binding RTX toxin-like protein
MALITGDQNPAQPNDSLSGTADPDTIEGLTGNDTIAGGGSADTLFGGDGNDEFVGGAGADSIGGAAGFDFVDGFQDAVRSTVNLNLVAGSLTLTDTQTGATTVDVLSGIEGGSGSLFADTFTGSGLENRFMPLGGSDSILGAGGVDDFLVVDYGNDHTLGGSQGIVGDLTGMNGTLSAGSITDTFGTVDSVMRIDAVRGSAFADVVTAGAEDLQFVGLDGADTFIGGTGFNEARYDHDADIAGVSGFGPGGINADLRAMTAQVAGTIVDGFGDTDSVIGIESVRGTNVADIVRAPDAGIRFRGLDGADTFIGGAGMDSVDYRRDANYPGGDAGVVVNLSASVVTLAGQGTFAAATARDGFGSIDQLKAVSDPTTLVDNVWGTDFADTLIGSVSANTLNAQAGADSIDGGAGDDSLVAGGGSDTLSGGEGNDTIEGGGGSDTAVYSAGRNAYTVTSAVGGGLQISFSAPNSQDFVDIVRDVEFFQFSNGTFTAADVLANQNQAPTAVTFSNVVALTENAVTPSGGIKVADIVVTDDGQGTNTLGLSGADAASFAITGTELFYLGGSPDFETKPSYAVTVTATDTGLETGANASRTIPVTNVTETFSPYAPATNAAASLANAILAGVPGLTINAGSVTYTGGDGQGSFYDGSIAGLGIGAGVLLTSGDGTPPLSNTSTSYGDDRGGAGDADLTTVLSSVFGGGTASFDANVLSFSFTVNNPAITSISLNAIFATDEYPDFVDNFVDIAAVFVNGVNYAYFDNIPTRPLSLLGNNIDFFRSNAGSTIPLEYDGISVPLSIVAPVTQGVNTIKIAVADTRDSAYDSALFISSLSAGTGGGGGIVTPAVYEISGTPTTTEGGTLTFTVSRDTAGTAATVSYTLTGTAAGSDYGVAPTPSGQITFGENELTKTIVLTTLSDGLAEGTESVIVTLTQATNGGLISQTNGTTTASILDGNQAPTAVVLSNSVTLLAENTAVPGGPGGGIRVADIGVADDALGTNTLSLTGTDAASFELRGNALYFVGASPDFETKASYGVTVVATDASLAAGAQQAFTLAISDVNEAPTVALANALTTLAETASTAARVKVADIAVTDDALGTNGLSLSGADAASFEIFDGDLYLRAGTALDAVAKPSYAVTVNVDDPAIGSAPDASTQFSLTISDVNQAPTAVVLSNTVATLAENTAVPAGPGGGIRVADIAVTDDALGTNGLSLTGADAASFALRGGSLYFVGASPGFETKASYAVTVVATDASLAASVQQAFTLAVSDVNEAPGLALDNQVTALSETASTAARVKIADITISDDALGANGLSLSGADAASFEIFDGDLYLEAGTALDAAAKPTYAVTVNVDDTTVGTTPDASASLTLTLTDVNQAPTAVLLSNTVTTLAENTAVPAGPSGGIRVADIAVTDDALGTNGLSLSGADAASFAVRGGSLYFVGASPDFETKTSYAVTVVATDVSLPASVQQAFTLAISNVNEAPGVALANQVATLAETANTAARVKVADIAVTDDALGTNGLSLSGTDAASFEIFDGDLYLRAGTTLDAVAKPSYAVTVNVDDATVGATPDASTAFALTISDVNQAPTAVVLSNTVPTLAETASTAARVKVADIAVTDDALGANTLGLTGADAASFEVFDGDLYLRAGTALNAVTKPSYSVTVTVDDATVGATPDASTAFALTISDVNQAPTAMVLSNTVTTLAENTAVPGGPSGGIRVADIGVTDDALGANALSLTSLDAASFAVRGGSLYFVGASPDFETKTSYAVTVVATDASLPASVQQEFTLAVSNVNEAPAAMVLSNTVTTLAENTAVPAGPSGGIRVADIAVTDDALGVNALSLTGTDATSFAVRGGSLYFVGSSPDFETKASYAVTVVATDASLAASVQQAFTLAISDVYEAPPPVIGSSGSDTLFGLGDAFTLSGGDGDDTYVIDSADDDVVETPTGGIERVYTRFSGTILAPNVENLVLETGVIAATGNAGGNEIAGNASGNVVDGAGGNDTVTGLGGDDTLLGGLGLDRLFGGDGDDSVEGGADADQLIGGGGIDTLDGGAGDDWFWGEDGSDSLAGGDGNDQLVGQGGLDTMAGGAGNDSYTLDDAGDVIIEADGQGTDTVFTTIGGQTLGAGVEILVLSGAAASGSGNGAANQLYGNGLDNTLSGGAGNDTIVGGEGGDSLLGEGDADLLFGEGGNDTLSGGEGIDQLVGGGGNDSILGGNGADLMWGDVGADTLDGGAGADFMGGGAGNDVFVVDDGGDVVAENAEEGTDTVLLGIADYVVGANIETVTMLAGAVQVFGNELANRIVGNGVANVIVGGAGADTLEGGGGDDWLFGDTGGNVFVGGTGNDTIVGSSDFATDVFRHAGGADGVDFIYGYDVSQGDVIDLAPATYDVVDNFDFFSIEVGGVEIIRVFSDLADGVLIA